jgi:hypothetical protein
VKGPPLEYTFGPTIRAMCWLTRTDSARAVGMPDRVRAPTPGPRRVAEPAGLAAAVGGQSRGTSRDSSAAVRNHAPPGPHTQPAGTVTRPGRASEPPRQKWQRGLASGAAAGGLLCSTQSRAGRPDTLSGRPEVLPGDFHAIARSSWPGLDGLPDDVCAGMASSTGPVLLSLVALGFRHQPCKTVMRHHEPSLRAQSQ